MKNLFFIVVALFAIGIFTACEDENAITCDQQTIISAEEYAADSTYSASIQSLEITENCLSITFTAGGCDGSTWETKLIDSGSVAESLPPQRSLKLSVKNEEVCLAIVTKTISFDIEDLQASGEESVWLNIFDSDAEAEQILYEY